MLIGLVDVYTKSYTEGWLDKFHRCSWKREKVPLQVSRNEKERIPRISYLPRNLRYLLLYDYETLLAN